MMMRISIFTAFCWLLAHQALCQASILGITDSLMKNANEIVMNKVTTFEIYDLSRSKESHSYEAIILNKQGTDLSEIALHYDDFTEIEDAELYVYDASGEKIEHVKLKDFGDYSAKGSSLANDSRVKYYEVKTTRYPYVIKVSYSYLHKGSMFYPSWFAQTEEYQAVLRASLTVITPKDQSFRHRSVHVTPEVTTDETGKTLTKWEVTNLKPFEVEPLSRSLEKYTPTVFTAPNAFSMNGLEGDLSTWDHYGLWINQLNSTQNTLTPEQIAAFKKEIPENLSDLEKVRATYDYLQHNSHYVSIQLGIGGWQPLPSGYVFANKYGDCKALSYLTKCLLETLGIKAYYTLINAGKSAHQTNPDFPEAHFNHAILTVPLKNDTIWLECTSQTNPFGYMGSFTGNRYALMITDTGAKVIKTRHYTPQENLQNTTASLTINEDGSAKGSVTRQYAGMEIENEYVEAAALEGPTEQSKWFYDNVDWGSLSLEKLTIDKPSENPVPKLTMTVEASFNKMAIANSSRLFYQPFVFTNAADFSLPDTERHTPVELRFPFSQADTVDVTFPDGFYMENPLPAVSFQSDFGSYHLELSQDQNHFIFIRTFTIFEGIYDASRYQEFRKFIRDVQKSDRLKMVMTNKT